MTRVHLLALTASAALLASSGCAAEDTEEFPDESEGHITQKGEALAPTEVARLVHQAGFPDRDLARLVCTAKKESSFNPRALHKNVYSSGPKKGQVRSTDYGLFQINSIHIGEENCPSTSAPLFDPTTNVNCAYRVYAVAISQNKDGLSPWYGYTNHKAECDAYVIPTGPSGGAPSGGASKGSGSSSDDEDGAGCWSGTLQETLPDHACVESKFDGRWHQCNDGKWFKRATATSGPFGDCSSSHPMQ